MLQMSKIIAGREEWKRKANERATEIRVLKKTRKRHEQKIAELKCEVQRLELMVEKKQRIT